MSKLPGRRPVACVGYRGRRLADERRHTPMNMRAASPAQLSQLCRIDIKGDKKDQWMRLPKAESSVTQHHFGGGKGFDYTATAGTLIVRDDEDKPMASIGYVAYTRKGAGSGPPDHVCL